MKKLKNLKGIKTLSKNEQKSINGGTFSKVCLVKGEICIPDHPTYPLGFRCCHPLECIVMGPFAVCADPA